MLTAFYDLQVSPPTYDFPSFLGAAEKARLVAGIEAMRVVIVTGPCHGFRQDSLPPRDPAVRRLWLDRIVIAACELLPSVDERVIVAGGRREAQEILDEGGPIFPAGYAVRAPVRCYGIKVLIDSLREDPRPCLVAPERMARRAAAELPDRLVTITLRQAEHWPERNSRVAEWMAAAEAIRAMGYPVEFVTDTAAEPISDLPLVRLASYDLAARAAVYARAAINFHIAGGPFGLNWQMLDAACFTFRLISAGNVITHPNWYRRAGLEVGMQMPCWSASRRLIWQDDTAANILAAFREWHDGHSR